MKKTLTIAATIAALAFSTQAQAGAAAVCIERDTNRAGNLYDSEFFMRWGKSPNVDGYIAVRAAKRDHKRTYPNGTPVCWHTGNEKFADGGYFVLIKSGREKDGSGAHMNKWALGWGIDRTQAIIAAKRQMTKRDPIWKERVHSYEISDEGEI